LGEVVEATLTFRSREVYAFGQVVG
jgi:hypothetical protein